MCNHRKSVYGNYPAAKAAADRGNKRFPNVGQSVGVPLAPYQCQDCHMWLVYRPRFRRKVRPYSRSKDKRYFQGIISKGMP
jgi:hypothetical protein